MSDLEVVSENSEHDDSEDSGYERSEPDNVIEREDHEEMEAFGDSKIRYYRRPQSHVVFGRGLGFDRALQAQATNTKLRRIQESISFINKGLGLERIVVEDAARAAHTEEFSRFYNRIKIKEVNHFRAVAAALLFISCVKHKVMRLQIHKLLFDVDALLFVKYVRSISKLFGKNTGKRWSLTFEDWKAFFEISMWMRTSKQTPIAETNTFELIDNLYKQLGFNFCMGCPALNVCRRKQETARLALHKMNGASFIITGPQHPSRQRAGLLQYYLYAVRGISQRKKGRKPRGTRTISKYILRLTKPDLF